MMPNNHEKKTLVAWMRFHPSSTDPLDYDLTVHHITMRSVYASLVTLYKNGSIAPQIATSWISNNDKSQWILNLNPTWTFANGDVVTPQIVLASFKRLIIIKNKLDSKSGLLEYLKGYPDLKKINNDIEGLQITNNTITVSVPFHVGNHYTCC